MADYQYLKGVPGQKNWYSYWTALIDFLQGTTNEVETARQGQASLTLNFDRYVLKSGWTANFNAMNYRLTGLADAVNPQDAVNLQTVQSLISGGGSPSNIPITALGIGTATALQIYRVNTGGTAIEGVTPSEFAPSIASDIALSNEMTYLLKLYGSL
jgi:hypothetical protein